MHSLKVIIVSAGGGPALVAALQRTVDIIRCERDLPTKGKITLGDGSMIDFDITDLEPPST